MKKFNYTGEVIPQDQRENLNNTILGLISNNGDMQGITQEDVFNAYTGIGGLHRLVKSSFNSYHDYSTAKKDFEQGQFFTPHTVCEAISKLIEPKKSDVIADISCGMGNFFNYFSEENCYGCEIDINAVNVASFLYPNAHIEHKDFRFYTPDVGMDYILGNPPFNLKMNDPKSSKSYDYITSQHYFFRKSFELLNPAGIIIAVVPTSFLKDEFFNKTIIEEMNEMFDFIGQVPLKNNTFSQMSVDNFSTKIMCFQKKSENMESALYKCEDYTTYAELKVDIQKRIEEKNANKLKLRKELLLQDDNAEFIYKVEKYLFEIKTHPSLQMYSEKAIKYVDKFYTQKCPEGEDYNHWFKHKRVTKNKVISYLKRFIKKQDTKQIHEIRVVKSGNTIKMKGYSNKTRLEVSKMGVSSWCINEMVTGAIPTPLTIPYKYRKLIEKKQKAYKLQNTPLKELSENKAVSNFIDNFYFLNKVNDKCYFNVIQKSDLKLVCQKKYSLIAWQQGGGKTGAFYVWSKYKPNKNTVIVAPSLAINLTWKNFLETNNESFIIVKKASDLERVKTGDYVLLSFYFISKLKRQLKAWVKDNSNKISLCFDESDEITNSSSKKTRAVLDIFRRVNKKLLGTGTTTRNNISELYSQLELLYNNSYNMMCNVEKYLVESKKIHNKGEIVAIDNPYYNRPFPPKYGQTVFTRCFNPTKSTVFGIEQKNQNIYNEVHLRSIVEKTILTKTFREIAGDKYTTKSVIVSQSNTEREVYKKIIKELHEVLPKYYGSTGNSRKDAMLRIIRQLKMLIDATSTPQLFDFYSGNGIPNKAIKIKEMVQSFDSEKVAIGVTSKKALEWYDYYITKNFPNRKVFTASGSDSFDKRKQILKEFEATENGILISTQQGLKSSVNVPSCNRVIVESLQWNISKMSQWYFRFIRYDSKDNTDVYFVNYENTIEVNILALLMAKEKLNDYIKTLDVKSDDDMYDEFDIDVNILDSIITKEEDEDGNLRISWGSQDIS